VESFTAFLCCLMLPQNLMDPHFFQQDPVIEDVSYRSPTPSGSVYFAEHFDDIQQFKKKWVLSEAKKDDIDDDIAKYDG
jgi:calnexin